MVTTAEVFLFGDPSFGNETPDGDVGIPFNPSDWNKEHPDFTVFRHHETGIIVCGHRHSPKIVPRKNAGDHLKKFHPLPKNPATKAAAKEKRGQLKELLFSSKKDEIPRFVNHKFPLMPVSNETYCADCKKVYKEKRLHKAGLICQDGHQFPVKCHTYGNDKVVIGPEPKVPADEDLDRRIEASLKYTLDLPMIELQHDLVETAEIAKMFGWTYFLREKTLEDVAHLIAEVSNDERDLWEFEVRLDKIMTNAHDLVSPLVAMVDSVAGMRDFRQSRLFSTFKDYVGMLKMVMRYTLRTWQLDKVERKYSLSEEVQTALIDLKLGGLTEAYKKEKKLDDTDKQVLELMWLLTIEPVERTYSSHPWVMAIGSKMLNLRGGFHMDDTYHRYFTAMQKMGRYIYVRMAWYRAPDCPQKWLQEQEVLRRNCPLDIVNTFTKMEGLRARRTGRYLPLGPIQWYPEYNQVLFRGKFIDFTTFGMALKRMVLDAQELMCEQWGVDDFNEIPAFDFHAADDQFFPNHGDWLAQDTMREDRLVAWKILLDSGKVRWEDDKMEWVPGERELWERRQRKISELMAMMYYFCGSGVARAPEVKVTRWRNNGQGTKCSTNFYMYRGKMFVHSFNQKSERFRNTGVIRFLTEDVSQIYMKVFRFAFPIMREFDDDTERKRFQPNDFHFNAFPNYRDWVNSVVHLAFDRYLGVKGGIKELRHIVSALFTMHGMDMAEFGDDGYDDDDDYENNQDDELYDDGIDGLLHRLLGHLPHTGRTKYGGDQYLTGEATQQQVLKMYLMSKKVQRWMGIPTVNIIRSTEQGRRDFRRKRTRQMMDMDAQANFERAMWPKRVKPNPGQLEIIEAAANRTTPESVSLVVAPTGLGKTAAIAAIATDVNARTSVVAVPTVALVYDLVHQLKGYSGVVAVALNDVKGYNYRRRNTVVVMTYEYAERQHEFFENLGWCLDVVWIDESHYIWNSSSSFRGSIKGGLQRMLTYPCKVMLMTGTLALGDEKRLIKEYGLKPEQVDISVRVPIKHPHFEYVYENKDLTEAKDAAEFVIDWLPRVPDQGKVIVFAATVPKCLALLEILRTRLEGHPVYLSCLTWWSQDKDKKTLAKFRGDVNIICATLALGIGVSVDGVSATFHTDNPWRIASYLQEAGRAGREGNHALAVLACKPDRRQVDPGDRQFLRDYADPTKCKRQVIRRRFDTVSAPTCVYGEELCCVCAQRGVPDPNQRVDEVIASRDARLDEVQQELNKQERFAHTQLRHYNEIVNQKPCYYCQLKGKLMDHTVFECPEIERIEPDINEADVTRMEQTHMGIGRCGRLFAFCRRKECSHGPTLIKFYFAMCNFSWRSSLPLRKLFNAYCCRIEEAPVAMFVIETIFMLCDIEKVPFEDASFTGYDRSMCLRQR